MAFRIYGIRPVFWPTLISFCAVVLALTLGTWQVQRLLWKQDVNASRVAKVAKAPMDALPNPFRQADHQFRRVRLTGRFLNDKEQFLAARSLRGNLGWHVITPFRMANGTTILVNRGWIPTSHRGREMRPDSVTAGTVTILGIVRQPPTKNAFTPDNKAQDNRWFWVDLPTMATRTGLGRHPDYYIELTKSVTPGAYPLAGQTRIKARNQHLQYVVTWYSLAIAGFVIWLLWHRARARETK